MTTDTHGTYWKFRQGEILPALSGNMQKYFAYALGRVDDHRWLSYLRSPVDQEIIGEQCGVTRNMWCTAGFLHTAGKTVTTDGEIADLGTPGICPVFDFMSIDVTCGDDGRTTWLPAPSDQRYIFRILDLEAYETAMTKALRTLLAQMP